MHPPSKTEEDERSVRFKQARSVIDEWLKSDNFKKRRADEWARSQDLTFGNHISEASAIPATEIKYDTPPMMEIKDEPEDPWKEDREYLKDLWREDFTWDEYARKVARLYRSLAIASNYDPRKFLLRWREAIVQDPLGPDMNEEYDGEETARIWLEIQWDKEYGNGV